MPYTAPLGNVVDLDFAADGYEVLLGAAVNLNFTDVVANPPMRIGFVWATTALIKEKARLNSTWTTLRRLGHRSKLNIVWDTTKARFERTPLDITYQTLANGNAVHRFGITYETKNYQTATLPFWTYWALNMDIRRAIVIANREQLARSLTIDAALTNTIRRPVTIDSTNGQIRRAITLPSPMLTTIRRAIVVDSMMRAEIRTPIALTSNIEAVNRIRRAIALPSPMLNSAGVIPVAEAFAMVDGVRVALLDVDVSVDEGQFGYTARMSLAKIQDYDLFQAGSEFTIEIGGEVYAFLFDGKQKPRSGLTDKSAIVSGISPCAIYAEPRAALITKTWTTPILASELAAELFPGEVIPWTVIDWSIPAPRLSAANESPINIMRRVLAAAGALMECDPSGNLYVRYRYPVAVPSYALAPPDQVYTDADHNFATDEGIQLAQMFNKLRIMDVTSNGFRDRIEFVPDEDDDTRGTLKVWPQPWRETFNVEHTSLPIVSVERIGVQTDELTETLEVVAGKGSFGKPVFSITSFAWLYADLGGIVVGLDETEFKSTSEDLFESLLEVTYTTRYVAYRAVAFSGAKVQFVVREPEDA